MTNSSLSPRLNREHGAALREPLSFPENSQTEALQGFQESQRVAIYALKVTQGEIKTKTSLAQYNVFLIVNITNGS